MPARTVHPALRCALAILLLPTLPLPADPAPPARLDYRVAATYPHDRDAYTQGLVYAGGVLYESTGLYGRSGVRRVELASGRILAERRLPARYFGEGLTLFADRLVQLTWRAGEAFVYDRKTLARVAARRYATEGWGLTHDGESLIMSDGSATLYFLDPGSFAERRRLQVFDDRGPVKRLNELEYVGSHVYANVWQTERIVVISPASGRVVAWIDLSGLLVDSDRQPVTDVANGIAYIPGSGRLLVTGKRWPKLFAIELETLP
jgi:glutamine cyclotransferase